MNMQLKALVEFDPNIHRLLKSPAAEEGKKMVEIIGELVVHYLTNRSKYS